MTLTIWDWLIIGGVLALMIIPALLVAKYSRNVADFLAANRLAGKYLLTVSEGGTGAVGTVSTWQVLRNAGLSTQWWGMMSIPVGLIIKLTGFVAYRYRETRALTMPQFLEMRYSRSFRLFSGTLCWFSGLLNYGIFPLASGRVVMTLLGLPERTHLWGNASVPTVALIMSGYLFFAMLIACTGGQISLMVSDFLQEAVCKIALITLSVYLLWKMPWSEIFSGLQAASTPGKSCFNPFDNGKEKNFDIWFYLIGIYGSIYSIKAWQGNSGYNAAAKTAHEAQMAGILGTIRDLLKQTTVVLPPLVAIAVFALPQYLPDKMAIQANLDQIADPTVRDQMITPMVLQHLLPTGVIGLVVAMFVSGVISVDDTYLHAWGTIFIQDVVMPWKKKPFSPRVHMLLLRLSIIGVAVFGFTFSMLFPFKEEITMFFAITGAIYLGGAGITIIGGLYWKRGTTAAAFTALGTGSFLSFGGMMLRSFWSKGAWGNGIGHWLYAQFPNWAYLGRHLDKFPINSQWIYFIAMVTATILYVTISLLTCKKPFNLEKMLHRGIYADEETRRRAAVQPTGFKARLRSALGLNADFNFMDKVIYFGTLSWSFGWWIVFAIGCLVMAVVGISTQGWSNFWHIRIMLYLVLGIFCTVWLTGGGIRDFYRLIKDLRNRKDDTSDDGFVSK